MKTKQPSVFFTIAIAAISLVSLRPASAQVAAHDDAAAYNALGNTWTNGMNLGFGFTPWTLMSTNVGGGFSGFFIGDGGGIATVNNSAFGQYANSGSSNASVSFRGFTNSLTTNQVFKIKWLNRGIGFNNGNRGGFALRNGNTHTSTDDVDAGSRFDFYYIGGSGDSFDIQDGTGVTAVGLPFGAGSGGLSCEFTMHADDTYRFVVKDGTGANVLLVLDNQPLAGTSGSSIDSVACYAYETSGNQIFNNLEISSTSLVPPTIANVQPTNNSIFLDPSTFQVSFEVDSAFSTISPTTNSVTLLLNGVRQTNLTFNATTATNQLLVTNNITLAANVLYNATIIATDNNGNKATNNFSFNTWLNNLLYIEAEDYNYSAGGYLPNPPPNTYIDIGGATNGVDVFKPFPNDGGTNVYRPSDNQLIDLDGPPVSADVDHNSFVSNGDVDYNLSFLEFGEWENYTRAFGGGGQYYVYARMASLSGNPTMEFDRLATNARASSVTQPLAPLGTCVCPADTGGGQSYVFVPLKDFFSNPVLIKLSGTTTNTFRQTRIGGQYNLNYFIFVPATNTAKLRPYISFGFPFSGANVGPNQQISFTIANRETAVNPATIKLFLNSNEVTGGITLSNNAAGTVVTYIPTSYLTPNSTNTLSAVFTDNDLPAVTTTNTWQFTVQSVTIQTIPGAWAQATVATPGFAIHISKADDNAPDYDFPTTLARAEAQLSGSIINTNSGLPYPNLAGGPNADGKFSDTNVINFDINAQSTGAFGGDTAFPYIPASGTNNFIAMDAQMYVQLGVGSYTFAVRSDDGFQFSAGPTPSGTNMILGIFDAGRDNSTASVFYFSVTNAGYYPMRLLFFQGQFGGSVELYSIGRDNSNVLLNDPNNANSIKTFQVLSTVSPVTLINPQHHGNVSTFLFLTQSGRTHFVEYNNTLGNTNWTALQTVAGDGSVTNITDSSASGSARSYRVRTQ